MQSTMIRRLVGLVIAIVGIVQAPSATRLVYRGIVSKGWPYTDAKLMQTEVRPAYSGSHLTDRTFVTYRYVVRSVSIHGDLIAFGNEFPSASRQAENLRNESPLFAYYDPEDPSQAVLHPGPTFGAIEKLALSLALIVAGVVTLVRAPR